MEAIGSQLRAALTTRPSTCVTTLPRTRNVLATPTGREDAGGSARRVVSTETRRYPRPPEMSLRFILSESLPQRSQRMYHTFSSLRCLCQRWPPSRHNRGLDMGSFLTITRYHDAPSGREKSDKDLGRTGLPIPFNLPGYMTPVPATTRTVRGVPGCESN